MNATPMSTCSGVRCSLFLVGAVAVLAAAPLRAQTVTDSANPSIVKLVGRLDLERYKATIKGLTQFGDRRQGTARNRAAIDWIERQLESYGCTPTARLTYDYQPTPPGPRVVRGPDQAVGGGRLRGNRRPTRVNVDSLAGKRPRAGMGARSFC